MSWAIGFDSHWQRDIGYGVPAFCDHPKCDKEIDRGLSYVCGGEPYGGERGCGLYFCGEHLWNPGQLCNRCWRRTRKPYTPKPEHFTSITNGHSREQGYIEVPMPLRDY